VHPAAIGELPEPPVRFALELPLPRADTSVLVRDARSTTKFFLALGALGMALVTVGVLGLHGLASVKRADDQVFSDNFLTAQATNRVNTGLSQAERLALEITATSDPRIADERRARLQQVVIGQVDGDVAELVRLHVEVGDDPGELREIDRIPTGWKAFVALTKDGVLGGKVDAPTGAAREAAASEVGAVLDPLNAFVATLQSTEVAEAAAAHADATDVYSSNRSWLLIAAGVALAAALVLVQVGLTLKRLVDRAARERRHGESASEYIDILQVTENEDEAQELLRRQAERSITGARAVVLARNNSDDRLEAKTSLARIPELREPLEGASPRSCLAVRLGRGHDEERDAGALLSCEICGELPGASRCEPLLVSGEVIGSVLINVERKAGPDRQRVREMVSQAAPVLANLRNLAIAELRAATDALTGLPNQRAVQDTLKRMVAQSARTISPLAALLVDLDHFKRINDVHGHDRGDEVLAAVGIALGNVLRDSDFAGRYGGEEFLLLLPSTDRQGALHVAEAVRSTIAAISIPGIDAHITASVGVAVVPDDAGDSVTLFRAADRALYAAKNNGRNRIEVASGGTEAAVPVVA
jgi:diguanylate cyclase (GGDEF)-like protein